MGVYLVEFLSDGAFAGESVRVVEEIHERAAEVAVTRQEASMCEYPVAGGREVAHVRVIPQDGEFAGRSREFEVHGEPVPRYVVMPRTERRER